MNYKLLADDIALWMKKEVQNAGGDGVVFGLSGGIDSAVIAGLSKKAFETGALGIIMPIHSAPEDESDARIVAKALDLRIEKADLTNTYDSFMQDTKTYQNKLSAANVKPRLRMTALYYYGQSENKLVLGASNLSEFVTGYFTKYGDSAADLMPLADLSKKEVYELAEILKIPQKIIDKAPSAGLWENQTDEDEMGVRYEDIEKFIRHEKIEDAQIEDRIRRMYNNSMHKRKFAKIYRKEER